MTEPQPSPPDPSREGIRKAEDPPAGGFTPSTPLETGIQQPSRWGLSKEPHPPGVSSAGGPHSGSPPGLRHDRKGWLAALLASLGFLIGAIGGGWVGTAVYQMTRGGMAGSYYGEIRIAIGTMFCGCCIGAVCGGIGGYLIGAYIENLFRSP